MSSPGASVPSEEVLSPAEERFDRYRKSAGAVLAPLAFAVVYLFLHDSGLKPEGRRLAAILSAISVLWVTEVVPLPITAILGAVLCIVLQVADATTVLAPFADPIIFLFIGSFILARVMMVHGLDRRVALGLLSLRWIGASPMRVLGGMGLVTALISMWVSNTATAAMMLPIALGILQALAPAEAEGGRLQSWPYATGMMLMVAYAASIGGIGTPVGSPPNLIGIALIRNLAGVDISFFKWMGLALPMFAIMGTALLLLLYFLHRPNAAVTGSHDLGRYLRSERQKLGPWTAGERNTIIAFIVAVTLWILPGVASLVWGSGAPGVKLLSARLPESVVALIAVVLLFVMPVNLREGRFTLTWSEAVKIDWGTILLFGGGLSLGTLMFKTGVAHAFGAQLTALTGADSVWAMTAVSIVIGILLSEITSNTASANMVIPVVIALGQAAGVNPVPAALGATFGASYGFMLPVSTPPNAIVYGSGLVPITRMIRAGIIFDVLGFFIIFAGLRVLCPLLGFV